MPDWSYQTVFRPLLFLAPAPIARDLALCFMGALARLPFGPRVIDLLGHMRPDPRLQQTLWGIQFSSRVGLAPGLDVDGVALSAFDRFGFGFLEVGPVTIEPVRPLLPVERDANAEAFMLTEPLSNGGLIALKKQLAANAPLTVPLLVRIAAMPAVAREEASDCVQIATAQCCQIIDHLHQQAGVFTLSTLDQAIERGWTADDYRRHVRNIAQHAQNDADSRPILVVIAADLDVDKYREYVQAALDSGTQGIVIDGSIRGPGKSRTLGLPAAQPALEQVANLRRNWGRQLPIIASGGIHDPQMALEMLRAGADMVQIDTGLVYAGPGLAKRINDAVLFAESKPSSDGIENIRVPAARRDWFWTLLLGISMFIGGLLALGIAATRVVMPYDEVFVGRSRDQLIAINDRLLSFMAHDRVTLAGTMIAIGVFYSMLSWYGLRAGLHWARITVISSAFAGFGSFFLFLAFGYFDPFHAFVTAILFQFLVLALHSESNASPAAVCPNLRNDWRWRWSQWGQLLLITHGIALCVAGAVIAAVGSTVVFVHEDLEFMQTTIASLEAANPRLLPLVAHDRASFGGMLISSGLAMLLPALWGFAQGRGWLWWMFLLATIPGYGATLVVHLKVGYTDPWHLLPAFLGAASLLIALGLTYPYLCARDPAHEQSWSVNRKALTELLSAARRRVD